MRSAPGVARDPWRVCSQLVSPTFRAPVERDVHESCAACYLRVQVLAIRILEVLQSGATAALEVRERPPPPAVPVPLEPPIRDIDGDDLAPMFPRLIALASDFEVGVRFDDLPGRAHGCYEIKTRRITIDAGLSANQKVKTFCPWRRWCI